MKYVVRLVTKIKLERPIQKFALTQADAESIALQILKACSNPGDRVEVFELAEIKVSDLMFMSDGTTDRIDPVTSERKCLG